MQLRAFDGRDLAIAEQWFDDADTQRWLGRRDWPAACLRLAGPNRHIYLALENGQPVGLVDCELYPDRRASIALITAPDRRRSGLGRNMIAALLASPDTSHVEEFFVGIERGNVASARLALGAGFVRVTDDDDDGFSYFAWRRVGQLGNPWARP